METGAREQKSVKPNEAFSSEVESGSRE